MSETGQTILGLFISCFMVVGIVQVVDWIIVGIVQVCELIKKRKQKKEATMPTREQIEDAQKKCIEKWEFMCQVCNGRETEKFYTDLWLEHSEIAIAYCGCAYCELFNTNSCIDCPIEKTDENCRNATSLYSLWASIPNRENSEKMLDLIRRSLDNYFYEELPAEELPAVEDCVCGNKFSGVILGSCGKKKYVSEGDLFVGNAYVECKKCKRHGTTDLMNSDKKKIESWNRYMRELKAQKAENKYCPRCGARL